MFLNLKLDDEIKIIDTHCHLDNKAYYGDLDEMLIHAFKNGIEKIIIPGADIKDLFRAKEIAQRYEHVFYAAGVHPYDILDYDENILKIHLKNNKCIAVGECGLDYFYLKETDQDIKEYQKDIFKAQLELAIEFDKPVIIHSREANEDTYNILKQYAKDLNGAVLHCFNASPLLLELCEYNFYFGIGGVLTFKNAKNLVNILSKIPKDRIVLETDGPYLTPEPFRGKRNNPLLISYVVDKISNILNLEREEVLKNCLRNSKKLFFKGEE